MNDLLTQALKEAWAIGGPGGESWETLEIRHPNVPTPLYIVKGYQALTATLEDGQVVTFRPVGFNLKLPDSTNSATQSMDFSVDNVNNEVGNFINQTKKSRESVVITYRPFLVDDLSTPQMIPPLQLYLKSVKVQPAAVSARASFVSVVNKRFPNEDYNRDRFPSLGG